MPSTELVCRFIGFFRTVLYGCLAGMSGRTVV